MPDPIAPASPIPPVIGPPVVAPPAVVPSGRGLKIALAVSVAINLAIAGLAAGAWLNGRHEARGRGMSDFGAFSEALSREDRRGLRRALITEAPAFRAARTAAEAAFAGVVTALRTEPFDPAALDAALAAVAARNADRLELGRALIATYLVGMEAEDRLALADRLEAQLARGD